MKDRGSDPKLKAMLEAIENNTKKNDSDEEPQKEFTYSPKNSKSGNNRKLPSGLKGIKSSDDYEFGE